MSRPRWDIHPEAPHDDGAPTGFYFVTKVHVERDELGEEVTSPLVYADQFGPHDLATSKLIAGRKNRALGWPRSAAKIRGAS